MYLKSYFSRILNCSFKASKKKKKRKNQKNQNRKVFGMGIPEHYFQISADLPSKYGPGKLKQEPSDD